MQIQENSSNSSNRLSAERRNQILEILTISGKVVAAELAQRFEVSEDTIRRDLREMAADNLIYRVHGGALPRTQVSMNYSVREKQSNPAKTAIARKTISFLRNGQVVAFDGGTTPQRIATELPHDLRITVVTHSLPVAMALAGHPNSRVLLMGGLLSNPMLSTLGSTTTESYRKVRPDLFILGMASLDPQAGIGTLEAEDAELKRTIIEVSSTVIGVVSGEKLGTVSPFIVAPVSVMDHLITDRLPSELMRQAFEQAGVQVEVAADKTLSK